MLSNVYALFKTGGCTRCKYEVPIQDHMRSYLFALVANYVGLGLTMGIQIFLLPFLLHRTGAKVTGLYYTFMTISNFAAVGIGWLTGAGVYMLAMSDTTRDNEFQDIHRGVFWGFGSYATIVFFITLLAAFQAGQWWLDDAGTEMVREARNGCVLLGFYIWIFYVHQADVSLFTAILQQGWAYFYRIVYQVIFVVLVVFLVIPYPRLDILMASNVVGITVSAIAARIHLRWRGDLRASNQILPRWDLLKKIFFSRGGAYFVFGIARMGLIYGDVLIIGAILGPEKVSAYLVVWKIPEVIALLLGRISEILMPYMTRLHADSGFQKTSDVFLCISRLQHVLAVIAAVAYGYFGPAMTAIWVGEANRPDVSWYYWLAGLILFIQVVNVHDVILHYSLAELKRIIFPQFLELGCKIGFTIALFPVVGIIAPLVSAMIIQLPLLTWIYRRSALKRLGLGFDEWFRKVGIWALFTAILAFLTGAVLERMFAFENLFSFVTSFTIYSIIAVGIFLVSERLLHVHGIFQLPSMLQTKRPD